MGNKLLQLIEPQISLDNGRKIFSDATLIQMIVPLLFEQLLTMMVGIADAAALSAYACLTAANCSLYHSRLATRPGGKPLAK